jgi:hypothetical protein
MAVDSATITIEPLTPSHWPGVARIYAEGIATGNATFEPEVPSWEAWDASHLAEHRFIALLHGELVGWAALSPVSDRCVYGGVVEKQHLRGRGRARPGSRSASARGADRLYRGSRHLDDPDRHLPGERGQHRPA